jgi:branched-chain amino acid aminotransferase
MKTSYAFVNDAFIPQENAGISIGDLGIQRGYGIFDFLRIDGTKPLFLEDHLDRFFHSAAFMRLNINHSREEIKAIVYTLIDRNNLHHSGLKLLLTGGRFGGWIYRFKTQVFNHSAKPYTSTSRFT